MTAGKKPPDDKKLSDLIPPVVGRAEAMELLWRCERCGRIGHRKDGVPKVCPDCGAPRGEIVFVTED